MRTIGLILGLMVFVILVSNIAAAVQRMNGIPNPLEIWFPEKFVDKESILAAETRVAPFADIREDDHVDDAGLGVPYEPHMGMQRVAVEMDLPHLHEGAVNKWVMQSVAEALTFQVNDTVAYEEHKKSLTEFMSANGLKEYNAFLNRIRAEDLMRSNDLELKTFVDGVPLMRTSGAVGGVYRWVYDVPLIMTFLPLGASDYREVTSNKGDSFLTENLSVRVQIGRVKQGGREGIIIETWDVLKKKS